MSLFDPTRPLTMAKFKTVLGHTLTVGTALKITDAPAAPGEIDLVMAERLHASGLAVYTDDFRPTPVEASAPISTPVPEVDLGEGDGSIPADLQTTNAGLREIAEREGVDVESDDNKAELQRKIMAARALAAGG